MSNTDDTMLPPEVLIKIFSFLDFKTTQKTCTLVSIRLVFLKLNNFYVRIYKSQTIIPPSAYFRPVLDHAPDAGFMIHVLLYIHIYTLVLIHKSKQAAPPLMTLPRPSYTPCSARLPSHVKQGLYLYSIFRLVFFCPV